MPLRKQQPSSSPHNGSPPKDIDEPSTQRTGWQTSSKLKKRRLDSISSQASDTDSAVDSPSSSTFSLSSLSPPSLPPPPPTPNPAASVTVTVPPVSAFILSNPFFPQRPYSAPDISPDLAQRLAWTRRNSLRSASSQNRPFSAPMDTVSPSSSISTGISASPSSSLSSNSSNASSGLDDAASQGPNADSPASSIASEPRHSVVTISDTDSYTLVMSLDGFLRDNILVSTKRSRILQIVADKYDEETGGHFERRISFGPDADMSKITADYDGKVLVVYVPRKRARIVNIMSNGRYVVEGVLDDIELDANPPSISHRHTFSSTLPAGHASAASPLPSRQFDAFTGLGRSSTHDTPTKRSFDDRPTPSTGEKPEQGSSRKDPGTLVYSSGAASVGGQVEAEQGGATPLPKRTENSSITRSSPQDEPNRRSPSNLTRQNPFGSNPERSSLAEVLEASARESRRRFSISTHNTDLTSSSFVTEGTDTTPPTDTDCSISTPSPSEDFVDSTGHREEGKRNSDHSEDYFTRHSSRHHDPKVLAEELAHHIEHLKLRDMLKDQFELEDGITPTPARLLSQASNSATKNAKGEEARLRLKSSEGSRHTSETRNLASSTNLHLDPTKLHRPPPLQPLNNPNSSKSTIIPPSPSSSTSSTRTRKNSAGQQHHPTGLTKRRSTPSPTNSTGSTATRNGNHMSFFTSKFSRSGSPERPPSHNSSEGTPPGSAWRGLSPLTTMSSISASHKNQPKLKRAPSSNELPGGFDFDNIVENGGSSNIRTQTFASPAAQALEQMNKSSASGLTSFWKRR